MPVSRNRNLYYTREQYQKAREITALDYARMQGYNLIQQGRYFTMPEHDSMIFTPRGTWFWNSRDIHGGAIEFCMYYEDMTLTEAVLRLAGETSLSPVTTSALESGFRTPAEFTCPEPSGDFRRLFAYLCKTRGLSRWVVKEMIQQRILYEGVTEDGYHHAVFVYYDPEGKAVGAFQRGMSSKYFKGGVEGSNKQYGWLLKGSGEPYCVCVFEAAIDAASHLCITGQKNVDRLSLEGLGMVPLWNYLTLHPQVTQVEIMLDNDPAGQRAALNIQKELKNQGYYIRILPPSQGKDYNEMLLMLKNQEHAG